MKTFFLSGFLAAAFATSAQADVTIQGLADPDRIPDQYIVQFKVKEDWTVFAAQYGAQLLQGYDTAWTGCAVKTDADTIALMAENPRIEAIYADTRVKINTVQANATQGIDRIDSRQGRDGNYTFTQTGQGVHAFVIDTGIRSTHTQFTGRIGNGFTAVNDGRGVQDCNGHGTHVSGTIGGTTVGVAKAVTIHPVRVLDCDGAGSNSGVLAGVDFVAKQTAARPAVANMSLGGATNAVLDAAVRNAISLGVNFAVAAGNETQNACNVSPARVSQAVTVGAINDVNDNRAAFSNFGNCVDIFAPGVNILSATNTGDNQGAVLSGTSMSSPHVAGAIALILQQNRNLTPAQVQQALIDRSTKNLIANPNGSPNRILFTQP